MFFVVIIPQNKLYNYFFRFRKNQQIFMVYIIYTIYIFSGI